MKIINNFKLIIYMLDYIWKADRAGFAWAVADLIWTVIPTAFNALIYKLLIEAITLRKQLPYVATIVVLYAFVQLISRMFSEYLYGNRFNRMSSNVKKYSNNLLLKKCSTLDMECYDDAEFYDKLSKALGQVNNRAMEVFYQVKRFFSNLISFIVGLSIISLLDPLMIVVALIAGVVLFLMDFVFVKTRYLANDAMIPVSRKVDYFSGLLRDRKTLSDVKQYSGFDKYILGKYNKATDEQISLSMELAKKQTAHSFKSQMVVVILLILFPYGYLAVQSFRLIITVADIPAMFNAFNLVANGFSDTSREISNMKESCLYIAKLKEVLDYESKIESNEGKMLETIKRIDFKNVFFKYPHSDNYILKDFNITIRRGEKIAIVGINGAGKTTFVKLLLRYYDPCEGKILIDNVDLREYNVHSVREKMTTLLQEFQPYNVPIDEMVACSETVDGQKARRVLTEVGLIDRLNTSPNGIESEYSKMFDENGVVLSGGELQRMFIARMRYKDGEVYIMDEPSSALDPIAEYEINDLMMKIAKDRTVVMIAHRLSTVVNADRIILVDDGKVLEEGSHKQLMKLGGKYMEMFNKQAENYRI